MLPTLLIKGKLVPPNGDKNLQKDLDEWIPLDYIINWFKTRQSKVGIENRVLILKSETASGKSTALPPALYRHLVYPQAKLNPNTPGIICTQPRVITAIKNLEEIMIYNSDILRLGKNTGWSTKYNKLRPETFGLLSATVGTLSAQLGVMTDEEVMEHYSFILIDETHERDLQTDMTIYMLKNLLLRCQNKPECPFIVLMSATFDPIPLLNYFKLQILDNFIWCRGETAGFDEMWKWNEGRTVNNYPQAAATVVEKICNEGTADGINSDILIFMPGAAEFTETESYLRKINKKFADSDTNDETSTKVFSILKIDGAAVNTENRDFKNLDNPVTTQVQKFSNKTIIPARRVIISTNVAETGLTLSNLKYVIDGGFNREVEFNPQYNINALVTKPAPQSRIRQRKGRAGRKFRGVFYPLYPEYIYNMLPEIQFPQILTSDISVIMLDIIMQQMKVKSNDRAYGDESLDPTFTIADIDMIDIPSPDALALAIEKLYSIGYISVQSPKWTLESINDIPKMESTEMSNDVHFGITKLGMVATKLGMMEPEMSRMILAAYSWNASVIDMITIAAWLQIGSQSITESAESAAEDSSDNTVERKKAPKQVIGWAAIYKLGLPGFIMDAHNVVNDTIAKIRIIVGDGFIDGLILFNAIKHILSSGDSSTALHALQKWCAQVKISFRAAMALVNTREGIIEQMLSTGFELFTHETKLVQTTEVDFMDVITKIKHCIYDGYRNNILIRVDGKYKTLCGIDVLPPKLFKDVIKPGETSDKRKNIENVAPRTIVYHQLGLKQNPKTQIFEVIVQSYFSSMDGFVSIDEDFIN